MSTEFVHLHVHTDYSLLDGACSIYQKSKDKDDLVKLATKYGMSAVAMTDHGVMGGAIEFFQKMNENAIKPIIGCEMYVSPTTIDDRDPRTPNIKGYHLVLLAKDFTGYQNLCKLNAIAHLEGHYYKPRIDKKTLTEHSKGLIGLSACLQGEIQKWFSSGKPKKAKSALQDYLDILGKDNFYLEIMDHGIKEQAIVNKEVIKLSNEYNIPLVATNDVHYLKKEHAKSHELLLCIQTNNTIDDEKRFRFSSDQFYFKTGDEMLELFKEVPESLSNTLAVAEKCTLEIPTVPEINHYPVYEIKTGVSEKEFLRNICLGNMMDRYKFDPGKLDVLNVEQQEIVDRMEFELNAIDTSHYCSYFLVVWDFLKYARNIGVPVGPGRGSGAGSIVAYLSFITDIEPIRYGLLFERFLNPERVSPPDFDIDFCERRRGEIIEYVRNKYGSDSVAQIGTYGTLKAKAVIKDVGRALGYSFDQRNQITKLMPNDPKMTLASSRKNNQGLNELIEKESWIEEIFEYSEPLEGLNRNMSIHAAGVIIGDQPLNNLVPLSKGSNGEVITQYPANPCETLGLLKMDFLGLRTLTIIQDTLDNIERNRGEKIDISKITLRDEATFNLLNRGDTIAVFQLESGGMRELCKKFGVERIQNIIALIALYRPGPMQHIGDFINRKSGKVTVEYDHPKMKTVLKETYGIMLYQEQIMQVVQVLAGFTLGGADILRRAISKKKIDVLTAQKKKFVEGCAKHNDIDEKKANAIWDKIEMFAGYGFNKSHSAAYAFLAYRTAYLKANYPVEFMTAVLTSELKNADKLAFFLQECKEMQINVLPPDVNSSNLDFTTDNKSIRFGLAAIKGVGEAASGVIIENREKNGKFKSITDFAEKVGDSLTSRVLENLVRAGAFDSFGLKRSQLVHIMPDVISLAHTTVQDKKAGQGNLFDLLSDNSTDGQNALDIKIPDIPEFHEQDMLKDEKELLGFYVSGHPLGEFSETIKIYSTHSISDIAELAPNTGIRIGGIISSLEIKTSKRSGSRFAVMRLEDIESNIECLVFSQTYEKIKDLLIENKPVFVLGNVNSNSEEESNKITVENLLPIESVPLEYTKEIHIALHEASAKDDTLEKLRDICREHPGETLTILRITCTDGEIAFIETGEEYFVEVRQKLIHNIKKLLGEESLRFIADKTVQETNHKPWKNKKK